MTAESGIFTVGLSAPVGSIPTLTGTTATYTTGIFNTLTATGISVDTITATGDITSTQNITATLTVPVNENAGDAEVPEAERKPEVAETFPAPQHPLHFHLQTTPIQASTRRLGMRLPSPPQAKSRSRSTLLAL